MHLLISPIRAPKLALPFASISALLAFASLSFATDPLPSSFDLRNIDGHSYIGPVHYQGQGDCFAFAANAAAESTYNRAMGLYDENVTDFSESFIVWSLSPFYEGFDKIDGADNSYDELQALVDYGVCSEADFPYTIEDPGEGTHMDAPRVQFTSWHRLPAYDIETMKRTIVTFGAADVGIMTDRGFDGYTDGVYTNEDTATNNALDYDASLDHAVALVGWNDDADGLGTGAWILRNSWGEGWGDDGYMNVGYYSMKALTSGTYLIYGDWTGDDFALNITDNINATPSETAGTTTAYGVYEWGGNNTSVSNAAEIISLVMYPEGDALTHGIFLWAGANAFIDNSGGVGSGILTETGMGTAYGLCLQGQRMTNSGTVEALAVGLTSDTEEDENRLTAYGARFFSFDSRGIFDNSGEITALAMGKNAYATGAQIDDAASVTNSGDIVAEAYTSSAGLICMNVGNTVNSGAIVSYGIDGTSVGTLIHDGSFTNSGRLYAMSQYDYDDDTEDPEVEIVMSSMALKAENVAIVNSGIIQSDNEDGVSTGVEMDGGSLMNDAEGVIRASSSTDEAVGLNAVNALIINNGTIIGNSSSISDSSLQGSGLFEGNLDSSNMVISPGNSIGTMTIDGDFTNTGTLTMNMEIDSTGYDQIAVTGFADLQGENTLNLLTSGYVAAGDYTFISADGFSGSFGTINSTAIFEGSVVAGTNGFTLDLARNSYGSYANLPELKPMGIALDAARPLATGDLADMLNMIDSFADGASISAAMDSLSPAMNATVSFAAVQNLHGMNANISRHWKALMADGTDDARDNSAWFSLMNGSGKRAALRGFPGYEDSQNGFAVGGDHKLTPHWTVGAAAAHTKQTIDATDSPDNASVKTDMGYAYALWDRNPGQDGLYFTSSFGAGNSRINTKRTVDLVGETAEGHHNARDYTLSMGTGYDMNNKIWTTRPFLDIQYAFQHENGYTEHDASGANLTFDDYDSESLQAGLGMSVTAHFQYGRALFLPELHILRAHEFMTDADDMKARFSAGPFFTAQGRDLPQDHTTTGMVLRTVIDGRVTATVDFEHTEYDLDDNVSDSLSAHMQIRF